MALVVVKFLELLLHEVNGRCNFFTCKEKSVISSLMKQVMKTLGLSQGDLAEVLEVSIDRVKSLTSGRVKKLTREESELLIGKLEIRAEWLITGEGPMLQDAEPQEVFANRMQAINQGRALLQAMPISDALRQRTGALLTGDPAQDGLLIAEALRHEFATQPALKPDEAALLDNYRHSPKEAQDALKATSAAFAQPSTGKRRA